MAKRVDVVTGAREILTVPPFEGGDAAYVLPQRPGRYRVACFATLLAVDAVTPLAEVLLKLERVQSGEVLERVTTPLIRGDTIVSVNVFVSFTVGSFDAVAAGLNGSTDSYVTVALPEEFVIEQNQTLSIELLGTPDGHQSRGMLTIETYPT